MLGQNEYLTKEDLLSLVSLIDTLQSRVLGLDMCVKGLALVHILEGGSYEDKARRGNILKETLLSLKTGLEQQEFMQSTDKTAFFSSVQGIVTAIDDITTQLSQLSPKGDCLDEE